MTALRPVVLGLCALGAICLAQPAVPPDQPSLERSVGALLQTLRKRGDLPPLDAPARERALVGMLQGLGLGTESPEPTRASAILPPIALKGLYAYIRVDHVGEGLVDTLQELLADVADGHCEAVVLDLRQTTGAAPPARDDAFAGLRRATVPTMALLGADSSAGAAQLAAYLQSHLGVVLVGQSPVPRPVPVKVVLATGERVFLPARPRDQPTAARLRMDLSVRDTRSATVTIEDAGQENWGALAARDECLRRAVDLLATMRALRQP